MCSPGQQMEAPSSSGTVVGQGKGDRGLEPTFMPSLNSLRAAPEAQGKQR